MDWPASIGSNSFVFRLDNARIAGLANWLEKRRWLGSLFKDWWAFQNLVVQVFVSRRR